MVCAAEMQPQLCRFHTCSHLHTFPAGCYFLLNHVQPLAVRVKILKKQFKGLKLGLLLHVLPVEQPASVGSAEYLPPQSHLWTSWRQPLPRASSSWCRSDPLLSPCAITASAPRAKQSGQKENQDLTTWFTLFKFSLPQHLWRKKKQ